MSGITVQQMADRVAGLMEDRLRIRGRSLAQKLRRGGRLLPRKVRSAAIYLNQSAERAAVPKLQLQLDHQRIAAAYDTCVRHLNPLGAGARRKAFFLYLLTTFAMTVFVTAALVIGVLALRGYL